MRLHRVLSAFVPRLALPAVCDTHTRNVGVNISSDIRTSKEY